MNPEKVRGAGPLPFGFIATVGMKSKSFACSQGRGSWENTVNLAAVPVLLTGWNAGIASPAPLQVPLR